jgi:hypothetical protein
MGPDVSSAHALSVRSVAGALAPLLLLLGCQKPPPSDTNVVPLGDERTMPVTDPAAPAPGEALRSWATHGWSGPWLPYPGTTEIDVEHDLGRVPSGVQVWLSFTEDGQSPGLAAGDLAQIRQIDERHVVVWNNTNASYFVRVVVF